MKGQGGFSIIELLVATAILFVVSGAVLGLLHDGLAGTPILEEAADLHQRARVVSDALSTELRASAAGPPSGALSRYFAAVEPRHPVDPVGSASPTAITLRYVPAGGAHARLMQPLAPGVPVAILEAAGCPVNTTACGFVAQTTAVIFDGAGHADFVQIDAIGPGILTITDLGGGRSVSYAAGAEIAEALQVTYFFDAPARQLRRAEGSGTFVVLDNVIAVTFDYFADGMAPMSLPQFQDGPFVGAGATAFDADLLRVRAIRAALRLETGVDRMRGVDAALFARPGTATGRRTIPDVVARVDIALRNGS